MRKLWMMFGAGLAMAQEPSPGKRVDDLVVVHERHVAAEGPMRREATFEFISAEMGGPGKVVKGAPYSADSITEMTQMLADGNRINRKSSAAVARDSAGRTRREHTLPAIGPWASAGEAPTMVFINDPVSGTHYVLNLKDQTARKMEPRAGVRVQREGGKAGVVERDVIVTAPHAAGVAPEVTFAPMRASASAAKVREESLGTQTIQGVKAEGKRTIATIAAGEVGNDLPIEIVTERWYSPELQVVVLMKHKDPRMGETTTRLEGIKRSEPAASLFQVPADFTFSTEAAPMIRIERREK